MEGPDWGMSQIRMRSQIGTKNQIGVTLQNFSNYLIYIYQGGFGGVPPGNS